MPLFAKPLLLILAFSLTGCAAVSVVGGVASLGIGAVSTAGSIALTGAGIAATAGKAVLPGEKAEPAGVPEQ